MKKFLPGILMLLSGFAGLVYQVLWMRQLGLLFGNTSHAAAVTLAAFFGGLAAGSWFWGRRSGTAGNPLLSYAWLEAGIAVTALLYFGVLSLFYMVYPMVYQSIASQGLLLSVKFLLAMLLVFPPAFLMGGTIPMMGQAVIRSRNEFGTKAARLYATNTLGAAAGAFTAAFLLVPNIGYRLTCLTAMFITGLVAAAAGLLSRTQEYRSAGKPDATVRPANRAGSSAPASTGKSLTSNVNKPVSAFTVYMLCFISGFGFLTLEVLWTRLLAQIHINSVYSFSAVLVIVLLALALGAAAASGLSRLKAEPITLLAGLLLIGGISVAISPFVFMAVTKGFQMLDTSGSASNYLLELFGKGTVVIGAPAFILGIVFPLLMKAEENSFTHAGLSIGRLSAVNTIGAIAGSLFCGFVFLANFGMWRTMQLTAVMYLAAGLLMPIGWSKQAIVQRLAGAVVIALLFTGLNPDGLRTTGWSPARPSERIIEVQETSDCTVSVVDDEYDGRAIKVNSNYKLGSTGAAAHEHFQGRIPLLVFPETRSIFFIGVGTGISVGGALDRSSSMVDKVVACELIPEVIEAARKYMTNAFSPETGQTADFTNGLFTDERVKILAQDGRHFLMASGEKFDIINGDLFLPYQSGAGSLYTREHFVNAKASLNPGGVFVQWLPMYQLTDKEFGTIVRTMLDTFEQVTVWRNNFKPGQEVLGLMGHRDPGPLPACSIEDISARRAEITAADLERLSDFNPDYNRETALVFYCGNLTASKDLFSDYPVNTDDRPSIEYNAPLSMFKKEDGLIPVIVGPRYEALVDRILARCPPDKDPMLAKRTPANRRLVSAGAELHRFRLAKAMNDDRKAEIAWTRFISEWTNSDGSSER